MSSGTNTNDEAVARPWADLLPEMCDLVLDRLDAVGVLRFPAACTAWAAASKMAPRLISGSPTLLTSALDLYGDDFEYDVEAGTFGLHDVATGRSFFGEAERLRNRTWIGGKDDWLVTTDVKCGVELLNPITGDRVPLPSFDTIGEPSYPYKLCIFRDCMLHHLQQVALCQTPAHPNGYLAVALFSSGSSDLLAITADGDEGWTPLNDPSGSGVHYSDVIAHNGKVLAVTSDYGYIDCWDMNGTDVECTYLLRGPEFHVGHDDDYSRGLYLATSSEGRLQVVCLYGIDDRRVEDKRNRRIVFKDQLGFFHARRVTLHELDDATTDTWRRVRDLGGDRALFVGGNCYPFYVTVPPGGDPNDDLQADCVYVADMLGCDAAAFDLKLGDDYPYEFDWPLYYLAVYDALQMPMWFRPTAHPVAQAPVEE